TIQEGAAAYLNRQYRAIGVVGVAIAILVFFLLGAKVSAGFIVGAALSGAAGYVGMLVSVRANVRTTQAASESLGAGLSMAFRSGAVTGMLVAGLALLAVAVYFAVLINGFGLSPDSREVVDAMVAL
ncbi:MAG TPA: sodium-translocating pyrophosphatase, partial [Rhodobiaceae bacterium]|nr:sodium-translocating pyrophosphatase [Rhodobiaceae bacterium]